MQIFMTEFQQTSIYQLAIEDSDDSDGEGGMGNVNRLIMRPAGHSGKAKRGHLCFDASFETGNLGRVDLINEYEYDLYIRPDTCSPKLRFWFNFTVDNVKQDQRVIFNIINFSKGRNLYNSKMTPIVKSTSRQKWQRIPKRHVFYQRSSVHRNNYILSFSFSFDKEDEMFQFALTYPYSYTRFQTYLTMLENKTTELKDKEQFNREQIGASIQNRRLELLTIGNLDIPANEKRRIVVIFARAHAGESPSSFVCQGLIEMLISSHPVANVLRDNVIFKIIPMLNPDGVFLGNYRSTLMGFDLNRMWHCASPFAHPTLTAVLDYLTELDKNKDYQLDFVIDIHAHSSLLGCFMYGNTYEDVYRYERHIVYPKLLANMADDYNQSNTMFNADGNKVGTARRYFCSAFGGKVNSYTFQVSFYGYQLKGSDAIIPYTEEGSSYARTDKRCGRNLVRTFLEYYNVTGVIPARLSQELAGKKKRPRTFNSRSSARQSKPRPTTIRVAAPLHYKDINIYYDSETSAEEIPFSSRFRCSPKKLTERPLESSPLQTIVVMPEPCLSIIDFNIITREDFERSKSRDKVK